MDVYSQNVERAHSTGFVGISADTDDVIDNLEVYEALINPRESERPGGQGGGGMMPPMMGGMGAGGGAAGAAQGGLGAATGAGAAATAATRVAGVGVPGVAPTAGPAATSAGVGASGGLGAAGLGAAGLGAAGPGFSSGGPAAAGIQPDPDTADEQPPADEAMIDPATGDPTLDAGASSPPPDNPDVISVDPAEVDKVARQWSDLATRMAEVVTAASDLQASLEDFGLVRQPAGPYGDMTDGIRQLAGGASKEFDEIAAGLSHGAQAYRDQETAAAQTVRSAR